MILGRDTAFQDDAEFTLTLNECREFLEISHARSANFLDGFDEMKHGMTVPRFEATRRAFREVRIRDFSLEEARSFVERFFPITAKEATRGSTRADDLVWIASRTAELLSGAFDQLLVRPVHAQMLCQIASEPEVSLDGLSKYGLFDRFVHFLIDRKSRSAVATLGSRGRSGRRFNASLALWLWENGGASTVTLSSVPSILCREAAAGVRHDYDDVALRKELTAGCLIEKAAGTIFFGHRSLQEFLVAEALIGIDFASRGKEMDLVGVLRWINPEIANFIAEAASSSVERMRAIEKWFGLLRGFRRTDMPHTGIRVFVDLARIRGMNVPAAEDDPWFAWISYFVVNQAAEFMPRSARAADQLRMVFAAGMQSSTDVQMGCLLLAAHALAKPFQDRTRILPAIIAAWLVPEELLRAIETARLITSALQYDA